MSGTIAVPSYKELLWPTLRAVREIGDSGTIEEIVEKVIELEGFTEEQQAVPHGDRPGSEIEYRLAWARTYLNGMGALDNSKRGVWSTTELGRSMTQGDVLPRHAEYVAHLREATKAKKAAKVADEDDGSGGEDDADAGDWKERLIEELLATSPDRFERLARRLLREAGFISATVTGKSGDGGIDGIGVYRLSLVSFPVFFQCKRYKGSVVGRSRARLPWCHEWTRRQGTPDHNRELHTRGEARSDPRRSTARRSHRRRSPMRSAQGVRAGRPSDGSQRGGLICRAPRSQARRSPHTPSTSNPKVAARRIP